MRTLFAPVVALVMGCGAPLAQGPSTPDAALDATPDATSAPDAAPPVDVAWGECRVVATQYAVQTCADATRASATLSSSHPSWLCDSGSEVVSVETCIARTASALDRPGVDTSFVTRCALDRLPAPCTCNCAQDRWRNVASQCAQFRRYTAGHITDLVVTAVRVGSCW